MVVLFVPREGAVGIVVIYIAFEFPSFHSDELVFIHFGIISEDLKPAGWDSCLVVRDLFYEDGDLVFEFF